MPLGSSRRSAPFSGPLRPALSLRQSKRAKATVCALRLPQPRTAVQRQIRDRRFADPGSVLEEIQTSRCPCNLANGMVRLSNYLVARGDAREAQVQKKSLEWSRAVNTRGSPGNVCDVAGLCPPDGCGGMDERKLSGAAQTHKRPRPE